VLQCVAVRCSVLQCVAYPMCNGIFGFHNVSFVRKQHVHMQGGGGGIETGEGGETEPLFPSLSLPSSVTHTHTHAPYEELHIMMCHDTMKKEKTLLKNGPYYLCLKTRHDVA